jgi:hypothetical protein
MVAVDLLVEDVVEEGVRAHGGDEEGVSAEAVDWI